MTKPFETFESELTWQQVSLLLDTVMYFEEAPKFLSIPDQQQTSIAVPLLADSLRSILESLPEEAPFEKKRFRFEWSGTGQEGDLIITLPNGKSFRQFSKLADFSPV